MVILLETNHVHFIVFDTLQISTFDRAIYQPLRLKDCRQQCT